MRKIFIADAHLRQPQDHNYRTLLHFLASLPDDTDTLFVLGDLFEFWIGYPPDDFPQYLPVLHELEKLHAKGVKLVYFEGNHDFHLGGYFRNKLEADIHPHGATIVIDGKKVYLCHGDEINEADLGYLIMRRVFHSRLTSSLTRIVPASWAKSIAATLGAGSRSRHNARRSRLDYVAILRRFATKLFRSGYDVVITGHFHIPLQEISPESDGVLVSLGDWMTHFTYAEWVDGAVGLKRYESDRQAT